jgi:xylan 1,4-beta-xylosidase
LLWNYHDKDIQDDGSPVNLTLENISVTSAMVYHYRIDKNHSNSYEVWKNMGSPQNPTSEQIQELEKSGQLEMMSEPAKVKIENNQCRIEMQLPRQAVAFITLTTVQ